MATVVHGAVTITTHGGAMYTSDERIYVNADRSKVVPEDSPEAAFLLVGAGGQIAQEEADSLGLGKKAGKPGDNKAVQAPPEDKAAAAPADSPSVVGEPPSAPDDRKAGG